MAFIAFYLLQNKNKVMKIKWNSYEKDNPFHD